MPNERLDLGSGIVFKSKKALRRLGITSFVILDENGSSIPFQIDDNFRFIRYNPNNDRLSIGYRDANGQTRMEKFTRSQITGVHYSKSRLEHEALSKSFWEIVNSPEAPHGDERSKVLLSGKFNPSLAIVEYTLPNLSYAEDSFDNFRPANSLTFLPSSKGVIRYGSHVLVGIENPQGEVFFQDKPLPRFEILKPIPIFSGCDYPN